MSYERLGISDHRQLDCLFRSFFGYHKENIITGPYCPYRSLQVLTSGFPKALKILSVDDPILVMVKWVSGCIIHQGPF